MCANHDLISNGRTEELMSITPIFTVIRKPFNMFDMLCLYYLFICTVHAFFLYMIVLFQPLCGFFYLAATLPAISHSGFFSFPLFSAIHY